MARLRLILPAVFVALLAATPSIASAAGFFGPVLPQTGSCFCNGGPLDWGCVLQVLQNLIQLAVSLGVILCVIWIAYAGFSLMVSGGNPQALSEGKTRALNAVIGIAVILCAWLIVDFVMKAIYKPDAVFTGSVIGPWNDILAGNGNDFCIKQTTPTPITAGQVAFGVPIGMSNTTSTNGGGVVTNTGVGACNASTVASAAQQGGVTMSGNEANLIACFAGPESRCGTQMQNYNWDAAHSPPPSTAYGPFQITLKGNSRCFNNNACSQAAGVSGPLNCDQAFNSSGYSIPGARLNQCRTAAANLSCAAVAADCVYAGGRGISAWSGNSDSTAAHQSCVAQFGH